MSYGFKPETSSYRFYMPPISKAVKFLLIVNGLIFIFQILFNQATGFFNLFGLIPAKVLGKGMVWQLITYMFLHANLLHILLNSLALYFFGRVWLRAGHALCLHARLCADDVGQ